MGIRFQAISCGTGNLQGLDEKPRSLPGLKGRVGWRIGLIAGGCTRSGVVVPVALAVPDFDMARRDKLFDFVSGVGSSTALETTLGLKSPD